MILPCFMLVICHSSCGHEKDWIRNSHILILSNACDIFLLLAMTYKPTRRSHRLIVYHWKKCDKPIFEMAVIRFDSSCSECFCESSSHTGSYDWLRFGQCATDRQCVLRSPVVVALCDWSLAGGRSSYGWPYAWSRNHQ